MATYIKRKLRLEPLKNYIHPTSIIEDGVSIGKDNYIGPFCIIKKGTTIGNNNRFESHVIID